MNGTYDFCITKLKIKNVSASCLLFETNHDKALRQECINLGYTVFEVRHPDNNMADPLTIEKSVLVNFWGYIALKNEKAIELLNKKLKKDTFFKSTVTRSIGLMKVLQKTCQIANYPLA